MFSHELVEARKLLEGALKRKELEAFAYAALEKINGGDQITAVELDNSHHRSSLIFAEIYARRFSLDRIRKKSHLGIEESIEVLRRQDRLVAMNIIMFKNSSVLYWVEKDSQEVCAIMILVP